MSLYAESWPFVCENPYGGVVLYEVHWAAEDDSRVLLVVDAVFDLCDDAYAAQIPLLLTHAEAAVWSFVHNTAREVVDEQVHEAYRRVHGSSVVEEAENGDDD